MTNRILLIAGLLALIVFGGLQSGFGGSGAAGRRCGGRSGRSGRARRGEAAVKAAGSEAQLRVPRTSTEQLSVTHYFAARGYRLVVGVGLDRDVAVAPVAAKYPRTRFVAVEPGQVARARSAPAW